VKNRKAASLIAESRHHPEAEAILSTRNLTALDVVAVKVEAESIQNTILDSGNDAQVVLDRAANAFRGTPLPGQ
jgi:inulin fructotransferase (DFA-I-forming)